jgi:Rad3-related DNA helicase
LFSATLVPARFYTEMLGLPQTTTWLDVASPFKPGQLRVRIVDHVTTRYQQREDSLAPIADVIAGQFEAAPGNYLAFFSSFDYMQRAADEFCARHPQVPAWQQTRSMIDAEREAFLARFAEDGQGIGFAVLGGAFAEGVDLPGTRLIGAFITTLGMPQFNPVNERIKKTLQKTFGSGHEYTYLYPGLRKVVQAAGRVVRTMDDRGHVVLIDPRFRRPDVRRLMPGWWAMPD